MLVARHSWLLACMLTACASSGVAPQPNPREQRIEELRVQLASEDQQRKAWAAWNAGEEQLVELVPTLLDELEVEALKPSEWKWPTYSSALLDALIRLDARVPAQTLAPFVSSVGRCQQIQACILAAREPGANVEALQAAQRSSAPDVRFLAAHVLARGDPRAAVLRALRYAQVLVQLDVVDPGQENAVATSNRESPSRLVIHADPDDPPAAVYSIVRQAGPGDVGLPQLPGRVGYRRTVYSDRAELQVPMDFQFRGPDGAALLWELARVEPGPLGLRISSSAVTSEELRARALPALEAQFAVWKRVLQSLLAQGLIEPSMTQSPAPLEFRCQDRRTVQEPSLINVFAPIETAWARRFAELGERALELDSAQIEGLRGDLGSSRLERRAWAAFAAGEARLDVLAPDLRASLASLASCVADDPRKWTLHNLLDALIRLRVSVGSGELAVWELQGVDTELLLLAAIDPARCAGFLAHCVAEPIPYKRHDLPWLVASNLLAQADPARAAALALKDLRVTLDVHVLDDPDQAVRGPSSNDVYGDARPPEIRTDFPPFAYYTLESTGAGGTPSSQRHPTTNGQSAFHYREYDAHSARLDLLRSLACITEHDVALSGYVHVKQVWSTPEALLGEVRARRTAVLAEWRALLDALDARGLLDPADRGRELPLKLRIEDLRRDTSGPFPDLRT